MQTDYTYTDDVVVPSAQAHTGQGLGTGNPADAFVVEPPRTRTKKTPRRTRTNFEMLAWLFMRLSGVVLVVLILGEALVPLLVEESSHSFWSYFFGFMCGRYLMDSGGSKPRGPRVSKP